METYQLEEPEGGESGGCQSGSDGSIQGVRLVDCQCLQASVRRKAKCGDCGSPLDIGEDLVDWRRLVTKMFLFCRHCDNKDVFSDPCKDSRLMNSKLVLASRLAGIGVLGLRTFCGMMGLHRLHLRTRPTPELHKLLLQKADDN